MKSRLSVKRRDGLLLAIFYVVIGIAEIAVLIMSNFLPIAGALAVLSLIAAYGLLMTRKWSVWLVIGLFFPQLVFGVVTLYASILAYSLYPAVNLLLLDALLISFIVLSFVSFVYVTAKRKSFQPE